LVGVLTGEVNGFDALDIDLEALGWRDQNRDRLPPTQVHTTRSGGWHFLFKHHPGMRNSASRIAPGVDVRADGGFIIWWAREGLPFTPADLAEWPDWLLELTTRHWKYRGHVEAVPIPPHDGGRVTLNPYLRKQALIRKVEKARPRTRNDLLNWAAFRLGEMCAEGVIQRTDAEVELRSAAVLNGLWREGREQCMATIKSGLDAGMGHKGAGKGGLSMAPILPSSTAKGKS
jgi:hypothetical protein